MLQFGPVMLNTAINTAASGCHLLRCLWQGRTRRWPAVQPDTQPHLLLLAWVFPPAVSGGVYRPLSLARYAARAGWKVTVVCGPAPAIPSEAGRQLHELVRDERNISLIRGEEIDLPVSYRLFPRIDGGLLNAMALFDKVRNTLVVPPSVVVASGPPFHVCVAGKWVAGLFAAPFVMDLRDEWTMSEFDFVQIGNADSWFERRCMQAADRIVLTTQSTCEAYRALYRAIPANRFMVLPNGWEPADFDRDVVPAAVPDGPRLVSFVGYMGDHAPADGFLRDLAQVLERRPDLRDRLLFRFVGSKDKAAENAIRAFGFPASIKAIAHVSKSEASRLMVESSAVLLINLPILHRYLPGKLFDYIASKSPLLLYGEGGEVGAVVEQTACGLIVQPGHPASMETALDAIVAGWCPAPSAARDQWLADHVRETLALQYLDRLRAVRAGT